MKTKKIAIEIMENKRGKFFWRLKSKSNGRVLAHSEEYSRLQACSKTANMVSKELNVSIL